MAETFHLTNMPQQKSAAKALRKSLKQYARNSAIRKRIKDLRKKALRAIAAKQRDAALDIYKQFQKTLDKASKASGFIKKNTAARLKSRLMAKIHALSR